MTEVPTSAAPTDWERIGSILGNDRITGVHITNLLLAEGIGAAISGSRTYEILVPSGQGEKALQVLRSDARELEYCIWFGTDDKVEAPKLDRIIRRTSVSSTIQKPEFGAETALGRFLRSKDISQLTAKYPCITCLSVHERRYLAAPKAYSTGYDVEIELQKSLRERDDGYRGRYQVYEGGDKVAFLGANEWRVE
jgi:hypothetical protein